MYILPVVMETVAHLKAQIQLRGSAVSRQSSSNKRAKATVIQSTGDFPQRVVRVKALIACHVLSVVRRRAAGDAVALV
jgi:hypothetical protein